MNGQSREKMNTQRRRVFTLTKTKILTLIILTLFALLPVYGFSQKVGLTGLNTCDTIHGIRIGLTERKFSDSCPSITNGIRLELFGNSYKNDSLDYHPWTPIIDDLRFSDPLDTFDLVNGLNFSIVGSRTAINVNGISFSLFSQKSATINGIQASVATNIAGGRINGTQASLVKNVSVINNGLQISLTNYSIAINGVQIGLFNDGFELYGVQIGLINKVNHSEGLQIGLWNINGSSKFPIINFPFY